MTYCAKRIASDPLSYGGRWEIAVELPVTGTRHVEKFDKKEDAIAYRDRVRDACKMLPIELESESKSGLVDNVYLWPDSVRHIACYAVTGGSEGHYVHVDVLHDYMHTVVGHIRVARGIFLAKTFRGMAHAQKMATRIAELLGA